MEKTFYLGRNKRRFTDPIARAALIRNAWLHKETRPFIQAARAGAVDGEVVPTNADALRPHAKQIRNLTNRWS
jgi:hypothetical protein